KEYLPNLKKMREMGVQKWIKYEAARWRCPRCGQPVSWYDAECIVCGEPRSNKLFPLIEDKYNLYRRAEGSSNDCSNDWLTE
ncbi:MAG: hypothetical protein JXC36_03350, partial [Candidatus Atribacteria bacterium]|nr:hypothetical protein [Candidatus Atribacteria bacterium]